MAKVKKREARPAPAGAEAHPEIQGWGVDRDPKDRPGVPFYRPPAPVGEAHWDEPEWQAAAPQLVRPDIERITPVFGTAQPPRGLPGVIRRAAYNVPEHRARRWLLLLAADRIEAYGGRLAAGALLAGVTFALWRRGARTRRWSGGDWSRPRGRARLAPGF